MLDQLVELIKARQEAIIRDAFFQEVDMKMCRGVYEGLQMVLNTISELQNEPTGQRDKPEGREGTPPEASS